MATFLYEAYDKDGVLVRGDFEAGGKGEVLDHLLRRSLQPVAIHALQDHASRGVSLFFSKKLTSVDVLFMVRTLATTIKAGMSISEALDMMVSDTSKPAVRTMLQRVQASVRGGQSLSQAFAPFHDSFPAAFIGMLKAGEVSGELDRVLLSLGQYLTKEYQLRQQVRSALIYPVILLCTSVGVVALLLIGVLPRLVKAFASSKVELPLITKVFVGLSNALTYSYVLDLSIVALIVWFFAYFRKKPLGKKLWFELLSHTPVANGVLKKIALVRFTRTFGNLISSGVSALEAMDISADSLGNDAYAVALHAASKELEHGTSFSIALSAYPEFFPKILIGLIMVGEKTGSLGSILITLADFYDDEASGELKNLTSILEPMLLLVMGLIVGAIALSILLPIYQLVGNVG